jgi:hypothetical protein
LATAVLTDTIGLPVLPIPTRVARGGMGPATGTEIMTLAAALGATSPCPTTLTAIGGTSDGERSVTVKVIAPEPALTPRATLADVSIGAVVATLCRDAQVFQ